MFPKMKGFISLGREPNSFGRSAEENQQEIKWYQDISLIVVTVVFLILLPVSQFTAPATAYAASTSHAVAASISCGDENNNHCYARQDWFGGMNGAKTTINIVQLNCSNACQSTGFIDNEMWLIDEQTSSCTSNKYGNCWVEAGYINDGYNFSYFWADVRPVDNGNLNFHWLFAASVGYTMGISIYKQGTNQFELDLVLHNSTGYHTVTYYSTNNSMAPNDIKIGMELAGTGSNNSNWGAPRADFTNNYWKGSNWVAQQYGNGPGMYAYNPPYINGIYGGSGGTGGDFWTNCC